MNLLDMKNLYVGIEKNSKTPFTTPTPYASIEAAHKLRMSMLPMRVLKAFLRYLPFIKLYKKLRRRSKEHRKPRKTQKIPKRKF